MAKSKKPAKRGPKPRKSTKTKTPAKRGPKPGAKRKGTAEVIRVGPVGWKAADKLCKHVKANGWWPASLAAGVVDGTPPNLGLIVTEATKFVLFQLTGEIVGPHLKPPKPPKPPKAPRAPRARKIAEAALAKTVIIEHDVGPEPDVAPAPAPETPTDFGPCNCGDAASAHVYASVDDAEAGCTKCDCTAYAVPDSGELEADEVASVADDAAVVGRVDDAGESVEIRMDEPAPDDEPATPTTPTAPAIEVAVDDYAPRGLISA